MENTKELNQFYTQIYNEYQSKMLNHVSMRIKNREEAEDLTQEIFVKVYKYLPMYNDTKGKVSTWLYTIAKNAIIDYYRQQKMVMSDIAAFATDSEETYLPVDKRFVENETPDAILDRNEMFNNVQKRMSDLPHGFRKIAYMFFDEQLSYNEIAEQLEMPLGTVKNNIFRIREILQKELKSVHEMA
jgi:RNA polymerase sigma-70 factor (ECF subfamily)